MRPDEEERFADFVRAHSATLFRTAYLMTGDYQRAEDVLQDSLVRICQRWSRIDQMASPLAYARKVVVNRAASWWRKKSSRETPMLLHHDPAWSGHLDEVVEHQRVWQAVLALPPRQRAVMVLRYYEDLTESQIAETLGVSPGTVKSHSHAAHRRLGDVLREPVLPSEGATP
jgi:RNA polymerase sigma-70 factor (sigma-E family)